MDITIEDRTKNVDFFAYAAYDTMPAIALRIDRLIESGRRMAVLRRYVGRSHTEELKAGLTRDVAYESGLLNEGRGRVYALMFSMGYGIVISADWLGGDEDAASERWHADGGPKDVTRVSLSGRGHDSRDQLHVITYNELGVGTEWKVVFDNG